MITYFAAHKMPVMSFESLFYSNLSFDNFALRFFPPLSSLAHVEHKPLCFDHLEGNTMSSFLDYGHWSYDHTFSPNKRLAFY